MDTDFILYFVIGVLTILVIKEYYKIKKLREKLLTLQKVNDHFYLIGNQINKVTSKEDLYSVMLDTAIDLIPEPNKGSVLILEEDGKFHFKVVRGFSEELKNLSLSREEVFLHETNNFSDSVIITNSPEFDEQFMGCNNRGKLQQIGALGIKSTLSTPIYLDDELVGVINIDSDEEGTIFTKDDLELMKHIRNQLQLVLKNFIIQDELRYMVNHDYLTGIYNKRIFNNILKIELEEMKKNHTKLFLATIDIDDFKKINDNYGHMIGDKTLQHFTKVLRKNLNRNNDIYARVSGDEFVVLFKDSSDEKVRKVLNNTRKMLNEEVIDNIEDINVNFSYGICEIDYDKNLCINEIFNIADKNMYKDKKRKGDMRM
ncbi:sensor domain-containing diguanylate cyclase [Clostridium ganghwense]|uniref:Sensor domain-containing diguanylate cyclase n=1 Tax=Clostridium ganghwense TaxID=312089 RepID=A0ABT4CM25_9CLOT|nr:sensor domain-containing diguanylate cyclase [Clostridium ganghwense]MCY6370105.1 sensor domain-containing diguanylate cyclase [Clostridium ganghwense]